MIQEIIADIKEATGLEVLAERSTKNKECVIYSLSKEYDNGAIAQYRLTISLLTETVKEAKDIMPLIDNLLITKGDEKKYNDINGCMLGGGGVVYDRDTGLYETISYYDLTTKSNIEWR